MREAGRFSVPADHPCLPGHFPGRPVVPGVLLLDGAFAAILSRHPGHRVAALDQVKFTVPVLPDQDVTVWHGDAPGGSALRFACTVAGHPALRGTLRLEPCVPAPGP